MKFKKIIPYRLKKLIPMALLTGACMLPSCKKEPVEPIAYKEKEIRFTYDSFQLLLTEDENGKKQINPEIEYYVADPSVKTIYLNPGTCSWYHYKANEIIDLQNNILEPVINYSEKIRGMSYFDFRPTEIVKVPPQDTMWFIEHGWGIRIPKKNENGR